MGMCFLTEMVKDLKVSGIWGLDRRSLGPSAVWLGHFSNCLILLSFSFSPRPVSLPSLPVQRSGPVPGPL